MTMFTLNRKTVAERKGENQTDFKYYLFLLKPLATNSIDYRKFNAKNYKNGTMPIFICIMF
jgi:hypothetical protein